MRRTTCTPTATATTVRFRDGKRILTDGPFAETREYVAKVSALYARYRKAMGQKPRTLELLPAR